jgi:hypothetical protein
MMATELITLKDIEWDSSMIKYNQILINSSCHNLLHITIQKIILIIFHKVRLKIKMGVIIILII